MEWKIGEIRQINDEWYQCIEGCFCRNCDLEELDECFNSYECLNNEYRSEKRKDNRPVIFKKLEKAGEPYMLEDKKFQKYRVFHTPYIYNKIHYSFDNPYYISLEIKQKQRRHGKKSKNES